MKIFIILFFACLLFSIKAVGQEFNKSLNKDSLLKTLIKDIPDSKKKELLESYNSGDKDTKEFLLFMLSMPRSSKAKLIENIALNYEKVNILKAEYSRLVPNNYTVSIEFNPENNILNTKENIDLKITSIKDKETKVSQQWNLT